MQRNLHLLFFFISFCSYSQINTSVYEDGEIEQKLMFMDSIELTTWIRNRIQERISEGFVFSGLDSIVFKDNQSIAYLHRGTKKGIEITQLRKKNILNEFNKRIDYLRKNGYPFASIRIDSSRLVNGILTGLISERKGPLIVNDSAYFFKKTNTNHKYIYQLLNHVPGKIFNESSFDRIDQKIQRSNFLNFNKPVDISFQSGKAKLYLDISEEESNSFQGIVGLQQQQSGKSNIVGGFDLNLQNLFKSGKELGIEWESYTGASQALSFSYTHPYLFNSRLIPYFRFDLLKQDSTFLKRSQHVGISTYLTALLQIEFGYTKNDGSLLTTEEANLIGSDIADFNSDTYLIQLKNGQINKNYGLRSEYAWQVGISLGTKDIDRNLDLANSFYDTLTTATNIFQFDFKGVYNKKILKRQTVVQQVEIGLINNEELLNNERYRLGGMKSLRGFDEKFFFAERYLLSRTEVRSYFEKGSFIYFFYDQLFFNSNGLVNHPFGTGLGFMLATLSGQFNFALAIGKTNGQQIDFSNMKAHFGYITNF